MATDPQPDAGRAVWVRNGPIEHRSIEFTTWVAPAAAVIAAVVAAWIGASNRIALAQSERRAKIDAQLSDKRQKLYTETATLAAVPGAFMVWAHLAGPLEVIAGVEVAPAGFALITAAPSSVFVALVSPGTTRWCVERWRERQHGFRELAPEIRELRPVLVHEDDDAVADARGRLFDLETKLRRLGVSALYPKTEVDYAIFIEMAERGAWKEARKTFPVPKKQRRPTGQPGPAENRAELG